MKIKAAFSSCPNDTFIFDAFVNGKIPNNNLEIEYEIADIDQLNKYAAQEEFDIIKLSFNKYFNVIEKYQLLTAGSAMGENCGPLLISKKKIYPDEIPYSKIAIPGIDTTANLLLNIFYGKVKETKVYLFSNIEEAVLDEECDAGLIIHETRFTYQKKGLQKISDLGQLWDKKFNCPVPLGGIAVRRNLSEDIKTYLNDYLRNSVNYALNKPGGTYNFVKFNAFELDDDVIRQHINLYVNNFTVDMGEIGRKSVEILYSEFCRIKNKEKINDKKLIL